MKLAFDTEYEDLREEFRKPLADVGLDSNLKWIETKATHDHSLWKRVSELGWLASAISEENGGSGLAEIALCIQAEEVGRSMAAIPFASSVCGYGIGLSISADPDKQAELLPSVASGTTIGLLLTEDTWRTPPQLETQGDSVFLTGSTGNVLDGDSASAALTIVSDSHGYSIVQLKLSAARKDVAGDLLDLLHPSCSFQFNRQEVDILMRGDSVPGVWQSIVDRYALFTAFEQLGGAAAALEMARNHALQRYAFGRPIASYQGLKHSFSDMFVALDLARSNCYFGAAALNSNPELLHEAACVARISATEAFRRCARGNMQMHGAMGVTWQSGCHLYYRRAQALSGHPYSMNAWKEALIKTLIEHKAAA